MQPKDRSGFEVAIICALNIEAAAVTALFSKVWTGYGKQNGDENVYTTGKINSHNIVLVHMPGDGTARAAAVAMGLRTSFTGIKLALIVGICGVVPFASEKEIILGDIIISDGVVQYDFGKLYSDRFGIKNKIKDSLPRLGRELSGLLLKLSIPKNLTTLREKTLSVLRQLQAECGEEYNYPGLEYDRLFPASYRHKHHVLLKNEDCITCVECKTSSDPVCSVAKESLCQELNCHGQLICRERLALNSCNPDIHIGTIASGSTVMKSGEHRDMTAKELDVIAFEMEGAGVWDNLPCLVIKAGCDYADSHKNDTFQRYAAATAASCAKAFLEDWREATMQTVTSLVSVPSPSLKRIFQHALDKFMDDLTAAKCDSKLHREVLRIDTKDQLLFSLQRLQENQKERGGWLHLERISLLLDKLQRYVHEMEENVIGQDTANQASSMVAVIWSPIYLMLLWSSELKEAYSSVITMMLRFAQLLPQFEDAKRVFMGNRDKITAYLALFYRDILDFHLMALAFFSKTGWTKIFDSGWKSHAQKEKIEKIEENIRVHVGLLSNDTSFEFMRQAYSQAEAAMKDFEDHKTKEKRQAFEALELEFRHQIYENRLHWLSSRACHGTGEWLLSNEKFGKWKAFTTQAPKNLWLQGIPGAGKTYLAYWAICDIQRISTVRTLYLFVSHVDASVTALSMVHSLLFQTAAYNDDIQVDLVDSKELDWKRSASAAATLLKNSLEVIGPLFIIIDGLDEVKELERNHFLQQLLNISSAYTKVKICISSRPETDIFRLFGKSAESIKVHENNSASIHSYARSRYNEWMAESNFVERAQADIKALFSTIAIRSDGMFLYARVVIDNVKLLNDVQEIIKELKALPEDLNAAYSRIFARLGALPPAQHQKVRKILGWMQCAPVPLTVHEMDQALLVNSDKKDAPVVESPVDILRLCGPIVEIVDEKPQFVHFTVKEYILNPKMDMYLDAALWNFDLLKTCLTYMSYKAFSDELTEDEVKHNIELGRYRLGNFAASQWFTLVLSYLRLTDEPAHLDELASELSSFIEVRQNTEYKKCIDRINSHASVFKKWRRLHKFFCRLVDFQADERRDGWTLTTGNIWADHDPTIISRTTVSVEVQYDALCRQAHRDKDYILLSNLRTHYGNRLYRCHYLDCPRRLSGFTSQKHCETHAKSHDRPFKCPVKKCIFANWGYRSKSEWHQHVKKHRLDQPMAETKIPTEEEELYPFLFQLVERDDFMQLEKVWQHCKSVGNSPVGHQLACRALKRGSLPIVQLIFDFRPCYPGEHYDRFIAKKVGRDLRFFSTLHFWQEKRLRGMVRAAIESTNTEVVTWILEQSTGWLDKRTSDFRLRSGATSINRDIAKICYSEVPYEQVIAEVMRSASLRVMQIWTEIVMRADATFVPYILYGTILSPTLTAARKAPVNEMALLDVWRTWLGRGQVNQKFLGEALVKVSIHSLSIPLAKGLIEMGAPIDFRPSGKMTPLNHAAKQTNKRAAEFMRFLLLENADPHARCSGEKPSRREGAAGISKWLNMDWRELVQWAKAERKRRLRKEERHRSRSRRVGRRRIENTEVIWIDD